jgi:hypothetical protein
MGSLNPYVIGMLLLVGFALLGFRKLRSVGKSEEVFKPFEELAQEYIPATDHNESVRDSDRKAVLSPSELSTGAATRDSGKLKAGDEVRYEKKDGGWGFAWVASPESYHPYYGSVVRLQLHSHAATFPRRPGQVKRA